MSEKVTVIEKTLEILLAFQPGNRTVVACEVESNRPLRVARRMSKTPPPVHAAAGARAILSGSEPAQVDTALKGALRSRTPNTVVDRNLLKRNLLKYKENGFAVGNAELDIGISAMGAPIFDYQKKAITAILVLVPTARFTDDPDSKMIKALKASANAVSKKILYKED